MCLLDGQSYSQKSSLLVLGDLHYDLLQDHDLAWLSERPGDLRQVKAYTAFTEEHWSDLMTRLKRKVEQDTVPVKAIIQLGDLSEGLAGAKEKAIQMAFHTMKAIDAVKMPVPWILTKGNHDVTGPGAPEAFQEYYVPMIREQTGNPEIRSANYSFRCGMVQVTCLDPWDEETDMIAFLEKELSGSAAKFKFVAIHEPVIPVTERCWHTCRKDRERREKLLEVLARNGAIVLCGHLHRYSLVRRTTHYGPILQVMVTSVVQDRNYLEPTSVITSYGPALAENVPGWQPESVEARKAILSEEAAYVSYYKQTDLPGFILLTMDEKKGSIRMDYYAAFGHRPYDTVDLTGLTIN